jgi:hypothetical protein
LFLFFKRNGEEEIRTEEGRTSIGLTILLEEILIHLLYETSGKGWDRSKKLKYLFEVISTLTISLLFISH